MAAVMERIIFNRCVAPSTRDARMLAGFDVYAAAYQALIGLARVPDA
jgi:hypothetical protein